MKSSYVAQIEETNNTVAGFIIQNTEVSDNAAKIEFVTANGDCLSGNLYDTATTKVTMGKFSPTKKFLNEIADTLAADMIDYIKSGCNKKRVTASRVYDENLKNSEVKL